MNIPQEHLSIEQLADLVDERTAPEESRAVRRHVAACPRCESQLARLQHLIHSMRADTSIDAPRDVLVYAKNIFNQNTRVAAPTLVRRIVAALSFDSFTSAPAFGTRSRQTETRQLLFSAQGNDIDVRVSPQSEGWAISGQVLGAPIAAIKDAAVLLQGASLSETAELNDLSEFSFPPVPPGSYKLNLRLGDVEVELPEIGLGL
jgi:anti-sigma factor RsiW